MKTLSGEKMHTEGGMSLVEVLVSFALFTVVVTVALGSLFIVVDANRKAQSLKSAVNNLNFAFENMTRNIRVGTTYHCNDPATIDALPTQVDRNNTLATVRDCNPADELIALESSRGDKGDNSDQIVYRLQNTAIERSRDSGANWSTITAADVTISHLGFEVRGTGSYPGDLEQPMVTITVEGTAGVGTVSQTRFRLQTSVSQRFIE